MADAAAIARRAIRLASAHIEKDSKTLAEMAGGDLTVLREAARIVQEHPQKPAPASLSAEHLAFSLISAAHELLRVKPTK